MEARKKIAEKQKQLQQIFTGAKPPPKKKVRAPPVRANSDL